MKIFDAGLLALPLFEERHRQLAAKLEDWAARFKPCAAKCETQAQDSRLRGKQYVQDLAKAGWFEYAFGDRVNARPDLRSICLMRQAFAYLDDLVDFAFSIQCISAAPIHWFGSSALRKRYLPGLLAGTTISCLALSEPEAGSNLVSAQCRAALDGSYFVTGQKSWVSNGDIADIACVLVRTGEGPGPLGLSILVASLDQEGDTLKVSATDFIAPRSCATLAFSRRRVDADALIGMPGSGYIYAMELLDFFRVPVGSAAIGFARRAAKAAVEWSRNRRIPGSMLIESQLTLQKFSDMKVRIDAASLLVARAAWEFDTNRGSSANASVAKLYSTEAAQEVVDTAVQLLGAAGLTADSITGKLYQQIRSLRVYEGTSEIHKLIVGRSMAVHDR